MPRVLVTGGAGFFGSHVVRMTLSLGWDVTVLDNLTTGLKSTTDELVELGATFKQGDIRDLATVESCMESCDAVIHLAAQVSVPISIQRPEETHEINIQGTECVIKSAIKFNVKNLVMASSAAVYGEADSLPLDEDDAGDVLSPYATTKFYNETQILEARTAGMNATALRFFNVYGDGQRPDGAYAAVIPKFVEMMAAGQPPSVFGDGEHTRDFIHVEDVSRAILNILNLSSEKNKHHVYNIATQSSVTLIQLIGAINSALVEFQPTFTPLVANHLDEREGDIRHSMASIKRITTATDWTPQITFERGIKAQVKAYLGKM